MTRVVAIEDLPREIAALRAEMRQACHRGLAKAAAAAPGILRGHTPGDRGEMRASWFVEDVERGYDVRNRAPHAPFIEGGTSPAGHHHGATGRVGMYDRIYDWVARHFPEPDSLALRGSHHRRTVAVIQRIQRRGREAANIRRAAWPELTASAEGSIYGETRSTFHSWFSGGRR